MFEQLMDWKQVRSMLVPYEQRFAWPMPGEGWQALPEEKKDVIKAWGEECAKMDYPMLTATQFMAFCRNGSRKAYENPYFERRRIFLGSVVGECLEHSEEKLDAVINGLWCICEESYWGLSAHNGDFDIRKGDVHQLPDKYNQYLDLFAGQTAAGLGITLRLLRERLLEQDTRIVERVEKELEQRVFSNFMDHSGYGWMGFHGQRLNNWTPWIVSSVLFTALAVVKDDVRLARIISKGMGMVDRWFNQLPDDGGLDEGVAYWNMAGGALLDCLECTYLATGGKADYYDDEKVKRIGSFPLMSYIGKGWHFNFADCDARPMMDTSRLYMYGVRTNQPDLAALGASKENYIIPKDTTQMNRVLDSIFTDMPKVEDVQPPKRVDFDKLEVWARSNDGLYAVIKGGHNNESHNHNDVGSFIVFADGEPVLIDAGNAVYTRFTFSDERYTLWHIRSANHNVPMIGEYEQKDGIEYCAKDAKAVGDTVTMDIAGAYPAEAGVKKLQREMDFGTTVTLKDHIELEREQPVTWVLMTRPEPEKLADGRIRLGSCVLDCPTGMAWKVETLEITDARMQKCYPGKLYRMTFTDAPALVHDAVFAVKKG